MKISVLLYLLCLSLATAATNESNSVSTNENGNKGSAVVEDNDDAMDRAVTKARESLGFFLAALQAKKPDSHDFEVKKCFIDGDKVEHIWVGNIRWDGKRFHGRVDNKPLDVSNVHLGQGVTVTPEDLTDWMFVKDGKLMGGYTMRVLYRRMSPDEKAEFQKEADFQIE